MKLFIVLFFTLFCSLLGAGIVAPLLPVFARNLGASALMIGFIFSGFSISRSVVLPAVGFLSDQFGRKHFILLGLFSYIIVSIAYSLAKNPWNLFWVRLGHGMAAAMIVPVASAYVGELSPEGQEGKYMGILNVAIFLGLGVGPFTGGLINDLWGMKTAFWTMAFLNFIGMMIVLLLVPGKKGTGKTKRSNSYLHILRSRRIVTLMVYRASHFFGVGIIWTFIPLLSVEGHQLSTTQSGSLISLSVLTATILQAPIGRLSDSYNRKNIALWGGIFMVIAMILIPLSHTLLLLYFAICLTGLAGGFISPAVSALTVNEGRFQNAMGTVMGIVLMGQSVGIMIGPIAAGAIADHLGISIAFFSGALVALVALFFFLLVGEDSTNGAAVEQALSFKEV